VALILDSWYSIGMNRTIVPYAVAPILFLFLLASCGVKGKPLPPEKPREIGIGKPLYKGVDQELNKSTKKDKKKK